MRIVSKNNLVPLYGAGDILVRGAKRIYNIASKTLKEKGAAAKLREGEKAAKEGRLLSGTNGKRYYQTKSGGVREFKPRRNGNHFSTRSEPFYGQLLEDEVEAFKLARRERANAAMAEKRAYLNEMPPEESMRVSSDYRYTPIQPSGDVMPAITDDYKLQLAERLMGTRNNNLALPFDYGDWKDQYYLFGDGYLQLLEAYKDSWAYPMLEEAILKCRKTGNYPIFRQP